MNISVTEGGDAEDRAALAAILNAHNEAFARGPRLPLDVFARDANGAVIGGLTGRIAWSWAYVDWLAVAPAHRGHGVGTDLINRAEAIARSHGCIGIYLWTTSFQAPQFYARHGYTPFGRLAEYPPGFESTWLMKRL